MVKYYILPKVLRKYLGVKIATNLSWKHHVNDLSITNWIELMLFSSKWEILYVSLKILRSIPFAISDLSYWCLVWTQNCSTIQQIIISLKKAFKFINLQPRNFHTSPLFKQNSILKFQDKISLENILLVSKSVNNSSLSVFNTRFSFFSDQYNYTRKPHIL